MKNNTKNIIKKKFNLSKKKLIGQPLSILKKINLENFTKITSLSLREKYNDFKEKMKQKEKNKIELFKKEKIKELKKEKLEHEKQKIEEASLIKQNELDALNEENQRLDKQEKLKIKITKQEQQIERKKIKLVYLIFVRSEEHTSELQSRE